MQQPRRFALLTYLAVADAAVRRDTLLGLFWPEKPEEDARHDLSQAIHYLRRSLGAGVIQGSCAEGFGIGTGLLACDTREFRAAVKRGDRAEALRLYRGDFLPGFYTAGSAELEQWLEAFRGQLRRQAAEAAWELAHAEAEVNAVSAAGMGRRAVELCLGDEAAVRRLIELLHRIGDRAGAFEAYESLRRRLAAEYGAEPSEETVRLMMALRARSPATDTAPVMLVPEHAAVPATVSPPPPPGDASRQLPLRRRPLHAAASAAVTVLLIGGFVSLWGLTRGDADDVMVPTVIVEDLRDYSRARARDDLAGAVTNEVVARLTGVSSIQVHPPDADVPDGGYRPNHLLLRAGLLRSADSVRVTAVLLDGRSRVPIDRAFVVRPVEQSISLVDDVAAWLAVFARRGAGAWVRERKWRERAPRGRALDLIRRALRDRQHADSLRRVAAPAALAAYQTADNLLARAELAAPEWSEPTIQRAETALRVMWLHLLSGPPDPARSRAALGHGLRHAARAVAKGDSSALEIQAVMRHWLWVTAPADSYPAAAALLPSIEDDLRRTLDRDATRARAWYVLAQLLQVRGDFGEARWAAERAHAADAFLDHMPDIAGVLFTTALETRDRLAARRWCDDLQQRNTGRGVSAYCELMLLATFGSDGAADVERARAALRTLPPDVRSSPPWESRLQLLMGVLLARAGATDSAETVVKWGSRAPVEPESAHLLAWGLLELGQVDSAASMLERHVSQRLDRRIGILRSERFRELREHPRIAPLLRAADGTN